MSLLYENILLDLDGTIVDSSRDIFDSLRKAFAEVLGRGSLAIGAGCIGLQLKDLLLMIDPSLTPSQIKQLSAAFRRIYDGSGFPGMRLYDGAKDAVFWIKKKGGALFLVTNKPGRPTSDILDKFGLNVFTEAVCPDCVEGRRMSKSEMVAYVLDKWGLDKRKTIMAGDTESDMRAARDNNIDSAYLLCGYGGKVKTRPPAPTMILADLRRFGDAICLPTPPALARPGP